MGSAEVGECRLEGPGGVSRGRVGGGVTERAACRSHGQTGKLALASGKTGR